MTKFIRSGKVTVERNHESGFWVSRGDLEQASHNGETLEIGGALKCSPKRARWRSVMPMKGRTHCAVPECGATISGYSNLCTVHRVPGAIVRLGESTMIITSWLAQHGQEQGLIALNDLALGDRFRGAKGFLAKLEEQGFANVRNLATPEELDAARSKKLACWSGPWSAQYPWHKGAQKKVPIGRCDIRRHIEDGAQCFPATISFPQCAL
jgi:hypothetical protein